MQHLEIGQRQIRERLLRTPMSGREARFNIFGEEKPKALGHDEASWAKNRRSDIVYQNTD